MISSAEFWLAIATLVLAVLGAAMTVAVRLGRMYESQRAICRSIDVMRADVSRIDDRQGEMATQIARLEGAQHASRQGLEPHARS